MRFYKILLMASAVAGLAATTSSCAHDDNWTPGPEVSPDCMSVYFNPSDQTSYTLTTEDELVMEVPVYRLNDAEAADVHITYQTTYDGFTVPSTVHFDAGQKQSTLRVDCSGVPAKTRCYITLNISREDANPYAAGASQTTLDIIVSQWISIAEDFTWYWETYGPEIDPTEGELLMLEGTQDLMFRNFLGTGLNIHFTAEPISGTSSYLIKPTSNAITYFDLYGEYDGYDTWFPYDEATGDYPYWSPNNNDLFVTYIEVSGDSATYIYFDNSNDGDSYCCIAGYANYSDGSENWLYVNGYFHCTFDPFAAN